MRLAALFLVGSILLGCGPAPGSVPRPTSKYHPSYRWQKASSTSPQEGLSVTLEDRDFTPTERKILLLLNDGGPHTAEEMMPLLWDDMSTKNTVQCHIKNIRKKLALVGHDIVTKVIVGKHHYLRVRLLNSKNDE